MAIPTAYLTKVRNLDAILDAIQKAGVPEKFSYEFLKHLGFASSSDRPIIAVLKALRFLDDSGTPLDRYRRYKDPRDARGVMAEALREAYADLYTVHQRAHELSVSDLQGLFGRLAGKGESVNEKMASTFKALANRADFAAAPSNGRPAEVPPVEGAKRQEDRAAGQVEPRPSGVSGDMTLRHDIHLHLPATAEIEVYDAIFRSLRANLGD
jgi:Family of unknown function (DUF5343)